MINPVVRMHVGCLTILFALTATSEAAVDVVKTNPLKVYMHYMPWFETPESLGSNAWGWHWRMNTKNPHVVDAQGRRQIAAHYYPKIGTYASRDEDVIEYHMLLMKLSGVDGLMLNWYGVEGTNGDIDDLLISSNAIVGRTQEFGLDYSVVLEDRFSANINQAKANVAYMRDNYFSDPNYIRLNQDEDPLLQVFGPITFQQPAQWTEILEQAGEPVDFLTLWYERNDAGINADGEYAWIYEDESLDNYQDHVSNFYNFRANSLDSVGGIAFPGFDDYYVEGGVGDIIPFDIPHDAGQVLANTLNLAAEHHDRMDFLQLATWNDIGEGTMFEPTVETGFDYLLQLQDFTGVEYGLAELELVYQLYRARKQFSEDTVVQALLDEAAEKLANLEIENAREIVDSILTPGDGDANGYVNGQDFLTWQRQAGETGYYPLQQLGSDTNADGIVDATDLDLWEEYFGYESSSRITTSSSTIPEPTTSMLFLSLIFCFLGACRPCHVAKTTGPFKTSIIHQTNVLGERIHG